MRVADLVLRYLEAVEWPVVVVLVAVLFRRSIRAMFGRLSELSGAGVSAKFQTEAERLAGRAAALSAEHDPYATTTGYPRPRPPAWDVPPPQAYPGTGYGDERAASPFPYAQQSPYVPSAASGDGDGTAPPSYAPRPSGGGSPDPVPEQAAPAAPPGETETVVPPPLSRPGDDKVGDMPQPSTAPPGYAATREPASNDGPAEEDKEPSPVTGAHPPQTPPSTEHGHRDDGAPAPTELAHGEPAADGRSRHAGYGGPDKHRRSAEYAGHGGTSGHGGAGGYGGTGAYGAAGYDGRPAVDRHEPGAAVPPRSGTLQQGAPPPPYTSPRPWRPMVADGPYATARGRADADPAAAIRLAWTELRTMIADLARGRSVAPRSGVHAQVTALGAGPDVAGLVRDLDEMRRDAAAGGAPVTAAAARAYVTAAEHVTAALSAIASR